MAEYISKDAILLLIKNEESRLRPYERKCFLSDGREVITRGYDTIKSINVNEFNKLPTVKIEDTHWYFDSSEYSDHPEDENGNWRCSSCNSICNHPDERHLMDFCTKCGAKINHEWGEFNEN